MILEFGLRILDLRILDLRNRGFTKLLIFAHWVNYNCRDRSPNDLLLEPVRHVCLPASGGGNAPYSVVIKKSFKNLSSCK